MSAASQAQQEGQSNAAAGPDDFSAIISHLTAEGWCVVPDILSVDRTARVLERLWAAVEENERRGASAHKTWLDPNAQNVRVFNLLELDAEFRDLIQHPRAIEIVRALLGEDFLISNFTANIARPGSGSMAFHSDQGIVIPEPWFEPWTLNIIWCLTDVSFENGGTLYLPGSHRCTRRDELPANPAPLLRAFEAKAGSIIAMEGRLWHTSGANITKDEDRALLFGYYTKPFIRSQANWNAALPDDVQAGLNGKMREWLGLGPRGNADRVKGTRFELDALKTK